MPVLTYTSRIIVIACIGLFSVVAFISYSTHESTMINSAFADDIDDILIKESTRLPEFQLTDQFLKPFTRDRFLNKWSFVFFGYTHCPDVCPVTLTEMDKLIDVLKPKPPLIDQFQYVFISVDPERDTPRHLAEYVNYFNKSILGVTGPVDQISILAKSVKIKFSKEAISKTEYGVNHSSALLLIDPDARYFARFRAPHDVDRIYQQFRQIARRVNAEANSE